MKILCVCQRGNSRSVALAYILKDMLNQDAIALGEETAAKDTKQMLYEWADKIIIVDKKLRKRIPKKYAKKCTVWDVGEDSYFMGFFPGLIAQYMGYLEAETGKLKKIMDRELKGGKKNGQPTVMRK